MRHRPRLLLCAGYEDVRTRPRARAPVRGSKLATNWEVAVPDVSPARFRAEPTLRWVNGYAGGGDRCREAESCPRAAPTDGACRRARDGAGPALWLGCEPPMGPCGGGRRAHGGAGPAARRSARQMRGAAMKVGQMISMVRSTAFPRTSATSCNGGSRRSATMSRRSLRGAREATCARWACARARVPRLRRACVRRASIGQVHRATTIDGEDVAVKIQYPGVAEAVDTDLRNAMRCCCEAARPGLDAKALAGEMRERMREELDYELEARNRRRIGRLLRGRASVRVPRIRACRPARARVGCVEGERFEAVRRADEVHAEAARDRLSALLSGCSIATASRSGTLTPVTCLLPRRSGVLPSTLACYAASTPRAWPPSGRSLSPSGTGTRRALKAALRAGGAVSGEPRRAISR